MKRLYEDVTKQMKLLAKKETALSYARFFKTGKGQYAEKSVFLGVAVPQLRKMARQWRHLAYDDIHTLLEAPVHEERLLALYLLTDKAKRGELESAYLFYTAHLAQINNWDLVDCSASAIVGHYLFDRPKDPLYLWAKDPSLWMRRIAIVATHAFIRRGQFEETCRLALLYINDKEDLIHKATGWMLREIGKKNSARLREFLNLYASAMPRTMLRYAIEKLPDACRAHYRHMKK